jgi:Fe-S-cluster containining protein
MIERPGKCTGECCSSFQVMWEVGNDDPQAPFINDMLIETDNGNFTCKYWDKETQLCTIYERRPNMCRNFPEKGEECDFCGWRG